MLGIIVLITLGSRDGKFDGRIVLVVVLGDAVVGAVGAVPVGVPVVGIRVVGNAVVAP